MPSADKRKDIYDVVVIGGGPAGLTAALYLARGRYRVVVVEKERFGGRMADISAGMNYPGLEHVDGRQLTETLRRQAQEFGAEFLVTEAQEIIPSGSIKRVRTARGELSCFGVLLATGAPPRMAGFQGEEEFCGRGITYCAATGGDAYTGMEVFVIGSGSAAARESVFLANYARHVTVLVRGDDFCCPQAAADAAKRHEKITVVTNAEVEAVEGDSLPRVLRYKNNRTGKVKEYRAKEGETFGVFIFDGCEPAADLVRNLVRLSEHGYVITDGAQRTSAGGIYAAGDICMKKLRQAVTAVGDGAVAATGLEHYALAMQKKTGISGRGHQAAD